MSEEPAAKRRWGISGGHTEVAKEGRAARRWQTFEERARLRAFCAKSQPGSKITSLLLNERSNGKRFWNLLFMLCLEEVNAAKQWETERYIIGVQTIVYYQ